jgi:heat shock protein HslJ
VSTIAASIGVLAMLATLAWCASLVLSRPSTGCLCWWQRFRVVAKAAGAVGVLSATFVFGFWLTSQPFPTGRKFVAVSLNGEPIISDQPGTKLPTLEVRRVPFAIALSARGTGHCNYWSGEIRLIPPNFVVWGGVFRTAMGCNALRLEDQYFRALLRASLWRIEGGALILHNGTDTLRFFLAPA